MKKNVHMNWTKSSTNKSQLTCICKYHIQKNYEEDISNLVVNYTNVKYWLESRHESASIMWGIYLVTHALL